jgi:hypothetical protein
LTSKINIDISVPEFSIPSLSALENVTVSTGFEDSLIKLNMTLPTLAELKEKLDELISVPFEALKKEINETRLEMAASFNLSILPVPALSSLSASKADELNQELCSDLDTSLIDDTAKALHKLSNVAIGLMFLLLFLVWGAMVFWEWRRWRALKDSVDMIEDEWKQDGSKDAWRVVAIVENPMLEKYGSPVLHRLAPNRRTRTNLRWFSKAILLLHLGNEVDVQCLTLLTRRVSLYSSSRYLASSRSSSSCSRSTGSKRMPKRMPMRRSLNLPMISPQSSIRSLWLRASSTRPTSMLR